ncbi:MAG: hypothetical protein KBT34_10610 [Prevotella sp.]|nr:hypothetical protein [Candidatus Prevotella equi]
MKYYSIASRSRDPRNPNRRGKCREGDNYMVQTFEVNASGVSNAITSVCKDCYVLEVYG